MKKELGFTSYENARRSLPAAYAPALRPHTDVKKRGAPRARDTAAGFALLLVCVLAFSTLFSFKAAAGLAGGAAQLIRSASGIGENEGNGGGNDGEDSGLGRLKLIRMPGLISVFAPSSAPVMPFAAEASRVEDDLTARLYAPAGTVVRAMLSGSVRSVAPGVVIIGCADDIDITYMGLDDISVERGQPVLAGSELGVLAREVLYLRVTRNGRPLDPLEFLGVSAEVG